MRRHRWKVLAVSLAACLAAAACSGGSQTPSAPTGSAPASQPAAGGGGASGAFPRHETLYTSGTQWGPPSNWNPMREWDSATGTKGLVYETLFLYDPNADQLVPVAGRERHLDRATRSTS